MQTCILPKIIFSLTPATHFPLINKSYVRHWIACLKITHNVIFVFMQAFVSRIQYSNVNVLVTMTTTVYIPNELERSSDAGTSGFIL